MEINPSPHPTSPKYDELRRIWGHSSSMLREGASGGGGQLCPSNSSAAAMDGSVSKEKVSHGA
jgi:hypothetical protein